MLYARQVTNLNSHPQKLYRGTLKVTENMKVSLILGTKLPKSADCVGLNYSEHCMNTHKPGHARDEIDLWLSKANNSSPQG